MRIRFLKPSTGILLKDPLTTRINVEAHRIFHQMWDGKNWKALDDWLEPNQDFADGEFGFYIPESDKIAVAQFNFLEN
jgi:hypothetical protein